MNKHESNERQGVGISARKSLRGEVLTVRSSDVTRVPLCGSSKRSDSRLFFSFDSGVYIFQCG